jgi:high-affinity Fe2+/Pb2+ permease
MKPQLIPYALMNVFGSFLALVVLIFYILFRRGKVKPKILKTVLVIFAVVMLSYGIYQLSVADMLRTVYPGKYYTTGGWIAISLGIITLIPILWGLRKNKNRARRK